MTACNGPEMMSNPLILRGRQLKTPAIPPQPRRPTISSLPQQTLSAQTPSSPLAAAGAAPGRSRGNNVDQPPLAPVFGTSRGNHSGGGGVGKSAATAATPAAETSGATAAARSAGSSGDSKVVGNSAPGLVSGPKPAGRTQSSGNDLSLTHHQAPTFSEG